MSYEFLAISFGVLPRFSLLLDASHVPYSSEIMLGRKREGIGTLLMLSR